METGKGPWVSQKTVADGALNPYEGKEELRKNEKEKQKPKEVLHGSSLSEFI